MGLNYSYFRDTSKAVARAAVMEFGSIRAAARVLDVNYSTMQGLVSGKTKVASERIAVRMANSIGDMNKETRVRIYAGTRHMKGKSTSQAKQSIAKAKGKKGWYKRTTTLQQKGWQRELKKAKDEKFEVYGSP